jgi:hypothetical protein
MAVRVVEGSWEEVAPQIDLQGRHVRVLIDDRQNVVIREITPNPAEIETAAAANPWLRSLQAWAQSHPPLNRIVDDSRDTLYEGLISDPR